MIRLEKLNIHPQLKDVTSSNPTCFHESASRNQFHRQKKKKKKKKKNTNINSKGPTQHRRVGEYELNTQEVNSQDIR